MKSHWLAFTMRSNLFEGTACLKDTEVPMQTLKKTKLPKKKNPNHKKQTPNLTGSFKSPFHWLVWSLSHHGARPHLIKSFPPFHPFHHFFPEIRFSGIRILNPSVVDVWSPIRFPDKTLKWNHFSCLIFLPVHILKQLCFLLSDIRQQRHFTYFSHTSD